MKHRLIFLLLVVALLVPACTSDDTEIAICSSLPLDNGANARAVSMSRAIEMAIAEQNQQGGVTLDGQRYTLRYVPMDDTSPDTGSWDTAQEERNARAAIAQHGCVAYVGTYNSGAAKIAIPILNRVQLPMISPGNTYPGLTKPGTGLGDEPWIYSPLGPDRRNYCRVVPADDLQAPAAARYAAEELGVERVYIFHDTELYGKGLAEIFADAARERGIDVVNPNGVPTGVGAQTMNPAALAAEILDTRPDLVYFGGVTANRPAAVLRELRNQGYEGYFMGADGIAERAFLEEANAANDERVFATLVGLPPSQLPEAGQAWVQRYRARYGEMPDAFAAPSYEAARVALTAIQHADSRVTWERVRANGRAAFLEAVRPAVLEAMKETQDFDGILGPWSFDDNCDTTDATISMNQARAGDFAFVDVVTSE